MSDLAAFANPRLTEIAAYLGSTRRILLEAVHAVPDSRWDLAADDAWSAGEVLEHLRIVEHGILRLLGKLSADARAAGHPAETETSSVIDEALLARLRDRSQRVEAPARVAPQAAVSREAGLAALAAERAALLDAMAGADGLALGSLRWVHPVFGELDLYRWLVSVGGHEARHAEQLHDIAAGRP